MFILILATVLNGMLGNANGKLGLGLPVHQQHYKHAWHSILMISVTHKLKIN